MKPIAPHVHSVLRRVGAIVGCKRWPLHTDDNAPRRVLLPEFAPALTGQEVQPEQECNQPARLDNAQAGLNELLRQAVGGIANDQIGTAAHELRPVPCLVEIAVLEPNVISAAGRSPALDVNADDCGLRPKAVCSPAPHASTRTRIEDERGSVDAESLADEGERSIRK